MAEAANPPTSGTDEASPTNLLRETMDQFSKVMGLEKALLKKSIRKHERDLEEISTELGMKEEELTVWEQRYQQIQQDNEIKLGIARARLDKAKYRAGFKSQNAPWGGGVSSLGFIGECDEEDEDADNEAEDDRGDLGREAAMPSSIREEEPEAPVLCQMPLSPRSPTKPPPLPLHPGVEAINALADIVAGEIGALRRQWQDLCAGAEKLAPSQSASSTQSVPTPTPLKTGVAESLQAKAEASGRGQSGRMTVEQRIDRLQRDIRTETDRILQERGTTSTRNVSKPSTLPLPSTFAGGCIMGPPNASGPLVAAPQDGAGSTSATPNVPSGGRAGSVQVNLGSGAQTPERLQSVGSRVNVGQVGPPPSLLPRALENARSRLDSTISETASQGAGSLQPPPRLENPNPTGSPATSPSAPPISSMPGAPGVMPGGSPVASSKAPSFPAGGAVMRCVSPQQHITAQGPQVSRRGPPQFVPAGRTVGAPVQHDSLQNSIGSAAGPNRWVGSGSTLNMAAPVAGTTTAAASPPPPVMGASSMLGSRGSSGTPSSVPSRTAPLQLSWR